MMNIAKPVRAQAQPSVRAKAQPSVVMAKPSRAKAHASYIQMILREFKVIIQESPMNRSEHTLSVYRLLQLLMLRLGESVINRAAVWRALHKGEQDGLLIRVSVFRYRLSPKARRLLMIKTQGPKVLPPPPRQSGSQRVCSGEVLNSIEPKIYWQFCDSIGKSSDQQHWTTYEDAVNSLVEQQYQSNNALETVQFHSEKSGYDYTVNFSNMTQQNKTTQKIRDLRRCVTFIPEQQ
jgi:hypothetical protein